MTQSVGDKMKTESEAVDQEAQGYYKFTGNTLSVPFAT